jgi:hypothetical protein
MGFVQRSEETCVAVGNYGPHGWTIWSNLIFLVTAYAVCKLRVYGFLVARMVLTALASIMYHICHTEDGCLFGTLCAWVRIDTVMVMSTLLVTIYLFSLDKPASVHTVDVVATVIVVVTVLWNPDLDDNGRPDTTNGRKAVHYGMVVAMLVYVLTIRIICVYKARQQEMRRIKDGDDQLVYTPWSRVLFRSPVVGYLALVVIAGAVSLYAWGVTSDNYHWAHGWWHMLAGLGMLFLVVGGFAAKDTTLMGMVWMAGADIKWLCLRIIRSSILSSILPVVAYVGIAAVGGEQALHGLSFPGPVVDGRRRDEPTLYRPPPARRESARRNDEPFENAHALVAINGPSAGPRDQNGNVYTSAAYPPSTRAVFGV